MLIGFLIVVPQPLREVGTNKNLRAIRKLRIWPNVIFKKLHVIVKVAGVLTAQNLVPPEFASNRAELTLLEVLNRNSRIGEEIIRRHVIALVASKSHHLLGRLIHP